MLHLKALSPDVLVTEREFAQSVVNLSELFGWLCYRTWSSIHSPAGYPDLCLLHPKKKRLVYAELKVGTNKPTEAQQGWLDGFKAIPGVEVYVWYPKDLDEPPTIREILERGEL